jgi:type VI secretion system protein ImpG
MINQYYLRELERLRTLGAQFSREHPALASMLAQEQTDPDVKHLLEGSAFLTGLVYAKLDDELPEFLYAMLQMAAPHYLRHIPCLTMIAFTPKRALREALTIKRGTIVNSRPIDGTACPFAICRDVVMAPMTISRAFLSGAGANGSLRLEFTLSDMELKSLPPDILHFTLAGNYSEAADLFMVLQRGVREIRLIPGPGGEILRLPRESFIACGFAEEEAILPYPPQSFGAFRHLQEYFALPERFCAFRIKGLADWHSRGTGGSFALEMDITNIPAELPQINSDSFRLFVAPAINLFSSSAEPIVLDHRNPAYLVTPSGANRSHYQVFSVNKVRGSIQGSPEKREYRPFLAVRMANEMGLVYSLSPRASLLHGEIEQWLSVSYVPEAPLLTEILSLDIMCTNGSLPERLKIGQIDQPSSDSPELADFSNLRPASAMSSPPLGSGVLWRLLSHLYLNLLSIANTDNLRSLLQLYIFNDTNDRASVLTNRKKVEAIADLTLGGSQRFVGQRLLRGRLIDLRLNSAGFAGLGDLYLFASVLHRFLASYAAINTYTELKVSDTLGKDEYQWPARLGSRQLL